MKTLTIKQKMSVLEMCVKVKMSFVHVIADGGGTNNQKGVVAACIIVPLVIAYMVYSFYHPLAVR